MPNQFTVKILANSLRKGGLLPEAYFNHVKLTESFIKAAKLMGFLSDEIECQIKTDREYCARKEKEAEKQLRSKGVFIRRKMVQTL